ncbi:RNA-binding region RNP-1 [Chytridium lagenaria]|nr:RNA-binding region RNP-1 [Chytridium lagenaria]
MMFRMPRPFLTLSRAFSSKTIYVSNLPWKATNEELGSLFSRFGAVKSARIVLERDSGRSRGFGFVEMEDEGATAAIEKLNGSSFLGRDLQVRESKPQTPRSDRNDRRGPRE